MIRVGLDTNGDGFICAEALPGDALNLIPDAVRYAALPITTEGEAGYFLNTRDTPYGTREFTIGLQASVFSAFVLGREGASVNHIPITPGQTYSAGVWVRAQVDDGLVPITLRLLDQTLATAATAQIIPTTEWQRMTVIFTAPPTSTHLCFSVEKAPGFVYTVLYAAGFMLVEGESLPAGFNSGDERDLRDMITPDVLSAAWQLGFAQPYDPAAQPTEGHLTVHNVEGRYSPEQAGAYALTPGSLVRIWSDDTLLFTGRLASVEPEGGNLGARRAVLHLHGPEQTLQQVLIKSTLHLNVQAQTVIESVLNHDALLHFNREIDSGLLVFPFVGDTWGDGLSAWRILTEVAEAEMGRCFSDRRGHILFYDRDHLYGAPIQTTLTDRFDALRIIYGDLMVNHMQVRLRPRELGTPGSVLWRLSSPQRIPANGCLTMTVRLRDDSGQNIAGTAILPPVANQDYVANSLANGTGTNMSDDITITVSGEGSAITLTLCNSAAQDAYLRPGSVIRGTPLIQGDALVVERTNAESIAAYGQRTLRFNIPYYIDAEEADLLLFLQMARRGQPSGAVRELTISPREPEALALTLFDRLFIQEGHTGHNRDYFIIAELHHIDLAGARHRITWTLEPVSPELVQPE
ncbi:MAG: hypothetical protein OHK0046_16510 [Anaerolineae bacterium]